MRSIAGSTLSSPLPVVADHIPSGAARRDGATGCETPTCSAPVLRRVTQPTATAGVDLPVPAPSLRRR